MSTDNAFPLSAPDLEPNGSTEQPLQSVPPEKDPVIYILPSNHWPITRSARQLFSALAPLEKLFAHGGCVCELVYEPINQEWRLKPVKSDELPTRLELLPQLWKHAVVKDGIVLKHAICSEATAKLLLGSREALQYLYPITLVVNSPILVEGPEGNGDVLDAGYHHHGRGTLVTKGERPPVVPLEEATGALLELLEDFQFELPSDRVRAVAMMLTPALVWGGLLGDAHTPMFLLEANKSQAGKGYLAERIAAIYGETLIPQSPRRGGVGSFDEDFSATLFRGKPLVFLDNLRDKLDSQLIEGFLTARRTLLVRTPHRESVEVDIRKFILLATSNGLLTTPDMENRLVRIRILKRPRSYKFKQFSGGPAFRHIQRNQTYYLGCVFSVLRYWLEHGKRRTSEDRHSFREWTQVLDWILLNAFKGKVTGRLMDEYQAPETGGGIAEELGFGDPDSLDEE